MLQLSVAKEMHHLLHLAFYPVELSGCVMTSIAIIHSCGGVLEGVGAGCRGSHGQHFADTALGISASEVTYTKHEPHYISQLGLWVHN